MGEIPIGIIIAMTAPVWFPVVLFIICNISLAYSDYKMFEDIQSRES